MKFRLIVDPNREEEVVATVHSPTALTEAIEELVLQYSGDNKLPVYTEDDRMMLPFSEIECITVNNGKTYAIDSSGTFYRVKKRLYEVEQLLPSNFIRINKSALANQNRLERFTVLFSGAVDAVFRCGYREYVSRRCFAEIKRRFDSK